MEKIEISFKGVKPFIAIPVHRTVEAETFIASLSTIDKLARSGIDYVAEVAKGSSLVESARNKLAHRFLKSDCSHIFWIDSDINWEVDAFMRLLALSTKVTIAAGCYPAKCDGPKFMINGTLEPSLMGTYAVNGLGLGFCCVRRRVIEDLASRAPKLKYPEGEEMFRIFRCDIDGDHFMGEDIAFFTDARKLGYHVHVDQTLELGHIGAKEYRGRLADAIQ